MKATKEALVIKTGVANIASMLAGLRRAGASPRVSEDPRSIKAAELVVLPGVGTFQAGIEQLITSHAIDAIRERVTQGRATLAVCLGLQLLAEESEEGSGIRGLGVIPAKVEQFPCTVRLPQIGWNLVQPSPGCLFVQKGFGYFANSFCLRKAPVGWHAAMAEYGGNTFVAALEKERVLACQFHPELSSTWGTDLLCRWVNGEDG